jgi:hypothetical protein
VVPVSTSRIPRAQRLPFYETERSSYVYVVHEPAKGRTKFGFSGDLARRLYSLRGWFRFDFLTSRRLWAPSWRAALDVEQELKAAFSSRRIDCDPRERWCCGAGELYDDCIYEVLAFFALNREKLCEGRSLEPIPIEWWCPPGTQVRRSQDHYQARGMCTPEDLWRRGLLNL